MTVKPSLSDRFSDFYVRHEYAVVLLFILSWQAVLLSIADTRLLETDSYTHALRLLDFIQSGSWQEILYRHDNCPYGQMLHFTRFTDMVMYVVTLPFLPFMELKKAVLYGCFLYNPVIAGLSAVALIWAGKAFFTPLIRFFSLILYFASSISAYFIAGRPDHHVLLNLLLILLAGCLLYGAKTQKTAYYKTAGVIAGLSVWTTPEGFLTGIFLFAGMIFAWLSRCQNMRQIRFFSQFFFISTAACLIANPPMQGFFHPDNGRLSILMVVVLGLAFSSFYMEEFLEREKYIRSFAKRFFSLLLLTLISLGIAVSIFGTKNFFSSPIPEELFDIWASKIAELHPIDIEDPFKNRASVPIDSCLLGIITFFLTKDIRAKKVLLTLGTPLIFFTVLMIPVLRFFRIEVVFSAFILPLSLDLFSKSFSFSRETISRFKPLCMLFLIFSFIAKSQTPYFIQRIWTETNDLRLILPYLPENNGCILSTYNLGPELAWLTDRAVIGTSYHSNAQGIIDNHAILTGKKIKDVAALLKKRQVSTIILDRDDQKNNQTFEGQLYSGNIDACFVRPVSGLPPEIQENFLIFDVDFTACDQKGK